jgi:hypothetical protein
MVKHFKTICSALAVLIFLAIAFGSGGSNEEREIDSLIVNGNSASFTFNVGFMYTSEHISLAKDVWVILKNNPEVDNINVKLVEVCEDQFGNKDTKISKIILDDDWIQENNVRSFVDEEKFGEYAWHNNPFFELWTPRGNDCY